MIDQLINVLCLFDSQSPGISVACILDSNKLFHLFFKFAMDQLLEGSAEFLIRDLVRIAHQDVIHPTTAIMNWSSCRKVNRLVSVIDRTHPVFSKASTSFFVQRCAPCFVPSRFILNLRRMPGISKPGGMSPNSSESISACVNALMASIRASSISSLHTTARKSRIVVAQIVPANVSV